MDKSNFELGPEKWQTLRRLLDEALAREPSQRAAWIDTLDGPLAEFAPRLRSALRFGSERARRSNTSAGGAQSSPITRTRRAIATA